MYPSLDLSLCIRRWVGWFWVPLVVLQLLRCWPDSKGYVSIPPVLLGNTAVRLLQFYWKCRTGLSGWTNFQQVRGSPEPATTGGLITPSTQDTFLGLNVGFDIFG